MKKFVIVTFVVIMLAACNKVDQEESHNILISGTFYHSIPGCIESNNSEINCIEFVRFENDSEITLLLGGTDIAVLANYERNENLIHVKGMESHLDFEFQVESEKQLLKTDDQTVWLK